MEAASIGPLPECVGEARSCRTTTPLPMGGPVCSARLLPALAFKGSGGSQPPPAVQKLCETRSLRQAQGLQLVPPNPSAGAHYSLWGLILNSILDLVPGKTQLWDMAILLDTEVWLHPFLLILTTNRNPEDMLWTTSCAVMIEIFAQACIFLGLMFLGPTRYSLRHGGASEDIMLNT